MYYEYEVTLCTYECFQYPHDKKREIFHLLRFFKEYTKKVGEVLCMYRNCFLYVYVHMRCLYTHVYTLYHDWKRARVQQRYICTSKLTVSVNKWMNECRTWEPFCLFSQQRILFMLKLWWSRIWIIKQWGEDD